MVSGPEIPGRIERRLRGRISSLPSPLYAADMGYVNAGVDHVRNSNTQVNPTSRAHSGGRFWEPRVSARSERYTACTPSSSMIPRT